jgi:hypothetical protein
VRERKQFSTIPEAIRSFSEEAKRRLRDDLGKLGILDQEPWGW